MRVWAQHTSRHAFPACNPLPRKVRRNSKAFTSPQANSKAARPLQATLQAAGTPASPEQHTTIRTHLDDSILAVNGDEKPWLAAGLAPLQHHDTCNTHLQSRLHVQSTP